jgi:dihydroorotate dehydrogenase
VSLFDLAARAARILPAETAHRFTIDALKTGIGQQTPGLEDPRLALRLKKSGLRLPNPIGLAAGFDKNAEVITQMLGFGFGFVECGTVTPRPQAGNPRPRLFRLTEDQAVINRMGFNNDGIGYFVRRLSAIPRTMGVVGANVGANKDSEDRIADYVAGVKAVWPYAAYVTINVSSPNTPGLRGLQDRGALEELLGRIGLAAREMDAVVKNRPVFLKVSNTTIDRPDSLHSEHKGETGGLSGAPLMAKSTRVLGDFHAAVGERLDLIGAGGISSAYDVVAKFRAGAQAVQLYSALVFQGPTLVQRIKADLLELMAVEGVATLDAFRKP